MMGESLKRSLFFILAALLIGGSFVLITSKAYADPLDTLRSALPVRIEAWKTDQGEDRFFDRQTIFDYIDGEGEVYIAYNMVRCLSRSYDSPQGSSIVMDIFDMGSPADAFGVFTHDREGEILDIGQDALYRPGWLSFWKERFFISIYTDEETAPAEKALKALAKAVASLIATPGSRPQILSKLPGEDLEQKSVRYLHHPMILNYHFYLSDENILHLGPETEAVMAAYRKDDRRARLLLVVYPDAKKAKEALASFFRHYLPEAQATGVGRLEDGKWSGAGLKDRMLAVVLESDSRAAAEDLLKKALSAGP